MNNLIIKWQKSGLLDTIPDNEKIYYAKNLERAYEYLMNDSYSENFEELVYPLIFRLTKIHKIFNVIDILNMFLSDFIIYGNNMNEVKFLEDFVAKYRLERIM